MVRATAAIATLLLASSAQAEPVAPEIVQLEDEPVAEKVVLEDEPSTARAAFEDVGPGSDDFRLDDIVNPYLGYQVPNVDQIVNPYRDENPYRSEGFQSATPPQSYAELCRRYCQDPPRSPSPQPDSKAAPKALHTSERDRLFEQRSNSDLRLMGGLVLAGTVLGAVMLVAGDPVFENEAGVFGTSVLIGGGLVVGLALVTTGDKVELRFARNNVARAR